MGANNIINILINKLRFILLLLTNNYYGNSSLKWPLLQYNCGDIINCHSHQNKKTFEFENVLHILKCIP